MAIAFLALSAVRPVPRLQRDRNSRADTNAPILRVYLMSTQRAFLNEESLIYTVNTHCGI
ncbi:hypothetical protein H1P_400020 [Hyella patelloides LEGE 07179]|uniref:Uncharacterized protein n=1 Tax=Hyella patelloides LEGE 07179 TaxID=945734 RepID=A0A563VX77_9CYAN|nr:hypothetical protein H1P_400020 [Hyella patelloides LEGE 07179]